MAKGVESIPAIEARTDRMLMPLGDNRALRLTWTPQDLADEFPRSTVWRGCD